MWNYAMERSFPCHNPLKPRCQNVLANEDQKQAMLSQKDCVSPVFVLPTQPDKCRVNHSWNYYVADARLSCVIF